MTKEEMIKQLEEAGKYTSLFLADSTNKFIKSPVMATSDIDTSDVCKAQNKILMVLAALRGEFDEA